MIFVLETITEFFNAGPFYIAIWFLGKTWWLVVPLLLTYIFWWAWMDYINLRFLISLNFKCLAVTVPKDTVTTIKVAENMFQGFWAIYHSINLVDKFWEGKLQEPFSVEIVGIDGHVRYILRMPEMLVDHFEAHLYAQYPDSEIMEVEDYTQIIPDDFMDKDYDCYGADVVLKRADPYPLRSYIEFEHRLTQEIIDPMASFAEVLSGLRKGEQVWFQIALNPITTAELDFVKEGQDLIDELMARAKPKAEFLLDTALRAPFDSIGGSIDKAYLGDAYPQNVDADLDQQLKYLSPGEIKITQGVQNKISKQVFFAKMRLVYIAKKDVYSVPRGFGGPMGAMQQYNVQDMNYFILNDKTKTKVNYFFPKTREKWRKTRIVQNMKVRTRWRGPKMFILSTEELATIFHFPVSEVKVERIPRTEFKKAGPPKNLPTS